MDPNFRHPGSALDAQSAVKRCSTAIQTFYVLASELGLCSFSSAAG